MTTAVKMDPKLKEEWIAALISGKYAQGAGMLRSETNRFCCLGVLCDLSGAGEWIKVKGLARYEYRTPQDESEVTLPNGVEELLGEADDDSSPQYHLASMNDRGEHFLSIADWISENL